MRVFCSFFFFFQADDGIRVLIVPGVQTWALPISTRGPAAASTPPSKPAEHAAAARPKPPELGAQLAAVDYPPLGIRGLLVESVVPGGLAELSGLLRDDLVLRAGGRPLTQPAALLAMIKSSGGIPIQLSVLRAGKPVEVVLRTR